MPLKDWSKAEYAFVACVAISIAGTIVALGGLASLQAFCDSNGDCNKTTNKVPQCSIFPGINENFVPSASLLYSTTPCSKLFRFKWWGWALQCFFLFVVVLVRVTHNVHNYKSALWAMAAVPIVLAMIQADDLLTQYDHTNGTLQLRGVITFLGYCAFCAGDFLMMFAGNALYHIKKAEYMLARKESLIRHAREGRGDSDNSDTAKKPEWTTVTAGDNNA